MNNGYGSFNYAPGPREVLHAIRQALFDDSSLKRGVPAEELAEQLIVRGYLKEEPSLTLVEEMLKVLEEGSFGLRRPTLQPCALEFFWDAEEGRLDPLTDLSMSIEWIGAPSTWWDRTVPEKLTYVKTPPCTDLISEPEEVLRNRDRWPIHFCEGEFTRQSTELWAEAQPFAADTVNVHRWASMYPLPIGQQALMLHPDVRDLSAWSEVLEILPFEEYEQAVWALRVVDREGLTAHTLDLFGLAEHPTYYVAGPLAFSVRGTDRYLIDVLDAAERWWAQFRGLTLRGRPKGTGTWTSREHFLNEAKAAVAEMRVEGGKITQETVAERFQTSDRMLRYWIKHYGSSWQEITNG